MSAANDLNGIGPAGVGKSSKVQQNTAKLRGLLPAVFGLQQNRKNLAGLLQETGRDYTKQKNNGRFWCMEATNQKVIGKIVAKQIEFLHQNGR